MTSAPHEADRIRLAIGAAFAGHSRVVLAVSGGLDSMALLHAAAELRRSGGPDLLVATFDHGTGAAATAAVRLVLETAARLGVQVIAGRESLPHASESQWRAARWRFLRAVAAESNGSIATAHTMDDQIETVFMRILRDAGPRGLAGLYAESDVIRPFVDLRRSELRAWPASEIRYVDDPGNEVRSHLRNRVRHDLLPAIVAVRPEFPKELLAIARRSAAWRAGMAGIAGQVDVNILRDHSLRIARADLLGYDAESLRALWPAIAARAGVVMDRRGTHRLADFTLAGRTGASIQLSGGVEVRMFRDHILLRRWNPGGMQSLRAVRARRRAGRRAPHALAAP